MKRYVIVGNGTAAAGCIEGIRSIDGEGQITVISEEDRPVYCRPLISYYLEGKTDLDRMQYRAADFYEKTGCSVLYGKKGEKIDPAAKTVTLNDGSVLPYDEICVAAGSAPFVPHFEGLDSVPEKYGFMTVGDALALEGATETPKDVLIVGAGLIGLKCAEGLHGRARSITVCDLADRILSSILEPESAAIVQKHLEANGLRFLLGNTVTRFEGNRAVMQSRDVIPFDVLVLAVGVKPNTALVKEIGGTAGRGITVNAGMETAVPSIYAAGDCTESEDISCGKTRVLAILPNAYMQGYTAGVNMAGGAARFGNAIPMNAIGFFGLHLMTAGSYTGEAFEEKSESGYKKLFTENGLLKGFILIGETQRAGVYTAMIRNRTPLESVDFDLLKRSATCAAFSAEARKKMFCEEV